MMSFGVRGLWGGLLPEREAMPAGYRLTLAAVLVAAFVLRFGLAVVSPNIHQADEVYQVAEQAHRAVRGYGIESWEFQARARSALYPSLVLPFYRLNVSATTRQLLAAALFSALSLIPVWTAFHWAARLYGLRGGIVAAVVVATWFELVYFASKPTADAICSYFYVAALFFSRPAAPARAIVLTGACLTLAVAFRMQIAPAVGIALVLALLVDIRHRAAPLLGGVAAALTVVGFVEWLWWGTPFLGHWRYLQMEFVHGASTYFGREPVTFFAKNYVLIYGAALPVVVWLAWRGAKLAPIVAVAAIAFAVPFHIVGHKEYRFLIPAVQMVVLLMGLAAAQLAHRLAEANGPRPMVAAGVGWMVAMIALSLGESYRPFWIRDRNHVRAFREIGRQPDACGLALVAVRWFHTPGYSGLARDIPIYETGREDLPPRLAAAANYVLVGHKAPIPPAPFARWLDYSRPAEHVYRRPGGCVPDDAAKISRPPGIPIAE